MASTIQPTTELPSAQEWKEVLEQILPPEGKWSEEEYLVLTDHRNRLVEFTDGFLEVLPMPTDKHQGILGFLYLAFFNFIEPQGGKVRFSPLRLRVRPGKFREPDLLLLLSAVDSRRQNRFWLGADLALEVVSEEKPERDLVEKRGDYAEGRVPEYWIVNPQTETISVLRLRGDAVMKKQASTGAGNRRRRCCWRASRLPLLRFSTRIECLAKASRASPQVLFCSLSAKWYDFRMKTVNTAPALDRLVGPLGECLTPESARRLLALKADPKLQARVDYLAGRCNQGLLTPEERAEYGNYVTFGTFVAILKSKARQLLANSQGE